jgi:hypothetical protein
VSAKTARNVLIIVALGAVVGLLPGGGNTADFVTAVLSVAITVLIVFILGRFYVEHRVTLFSLGDRYRALLYGAVGVFVVAMVARPRLFDSGAGTLVWFAAIFGVVGALYAVWQRHRSYGY